MKYLFFTDPHIGVKRNAHTTSHSQELLRSFLYTSVTSALQKWHEAPEVLLHLPRNHQSPIKVFCLGDLVDTYTNKEDVIAQAAHVAEYCDVLLAGNHDSRNNVESKSTLQLLEEMKDSQLGTTYVISPNGAEPYYWEVGMEDNCATFFIPHCFTQDVFEQSIDLVISERARLNDDRFCILALHCNVDEVHGESEADSSTLVLTGELQERVKDAFDLILVGHEHTARKKGKLQILGNWFPVSFGEIADRFVWWFDTETKKLEKELIFAASDIACEIEASDLIEAEGDIQLPHRLVDIVGDVEAIDYPTLTRALAKFWKTNEETLFSVRNSVSIGARRDVKNTKRFNAMTLIERVEVAAGQSGYSSELKTLVNEMAQEEEA